MNYTQCGSALALPYADGIAQTCVTSPPYYGLRDYGTARWEGGDAGCDHISGTTSPRSSRPLGLLHAGSDDAWHTTPYRDTCGKCGARRIDSQIGLEQTPAAYVAQIVAAMREVWRVLRPDGTLWLNLGDSYSNKTVGPRNGGTLNQWKDGGRRNPDVADQGIVRDSGMASKQLLGIPWRVAFGLQDAGWYLRSDIVWAKPNPMPESVTDRPTKAHEYVFLLAKQPRYFYDAEAIKEQQADASAERARYGWNGRTDDGSNGARTGAGIRKMAESGMSMGEAGLIPLDGKRNARSVWTIATTPYSGAHFATMPPELARRCILAGSSARGQCPKCGSPWTRQVEGTKYEPPIAENGERNVDASRGDKTRKLSGKDYNDQVKRTTTGWAASCDCAAGDPVPQIVLDPFAGSGTTAMVALQNGRRAIGTELNPAYLRLQDDRTEVTIGLGL